MHSLTAQRLERSSVRKPRRPAQQRSLRQDWMRKDLFPSQFLTAFGQEQPQMTVTTSGIKTDALRSTQESNLKRSRVNYSTRRSSDCPQWKHQMTQLRNKVAI